MILPPGATSVSVDVFFADDTGAALTGKVAADFPACKWSGGSNTADTAITLSDLAAITTAHPNDNTAGGVKEREGGVYRLDVPNNVFTAAGRKALTFAETTNKRIIVLGGLFDVQYPQADTRQWLGSTAPANTGDAFARLGAPAGASIAADLAEIEGETDGIASIPTNPYTGTPPTAAAIAAAVWQDTTAGDFTVSGSPGFMFTSIGAAGVKFTATALANAPGGGNVTVGGYAAGQDPATLVLDVAASGHNIAASIGAKINSAGAAADPLTNPVPGSYASGTAGAALGKLASGTAVLTQAVSADGGTLNTIRGNDYFLTDSADLTWTNPGNWPDLTGATITLASYGSTAAALLTKAGSVVTPTGPSAKVRVELAKADVLALAAGRYVFDLTATLADGHVRTLARGTHVNAGPL